MNFFLTGTLMFIKQIFSSKRYVIAIVSIPFIVLFLCLIVPEDDYNNISVGIAFSDKSSISNKVVNILEKDENLKYVFYDFNNIDEIKRDVASNKIHIGYIIPENIDEVINSRNFKDIIIKLKSPASYLSTITDEAICSTLIQVLSPFYAENFLYESNLINYDESIINYMIERTSAYLIDGDIMKFEIFHVNGNETAEVYSLDDNIFIFACLILSLFILSSNLLISTFSSDYNNRLFNYYTSKGQSGYIIKACYYSALAVISLFYTFITLFVLSTFIDVKESLYYLALIMFISFIIFTGGFCSFVSKYSILSKMMTITLPLILFGNFVFSGFLISTKYFGNVIDMISYIFPAKYFLTGLLSPEINLFSIDFLVNPLVLIIIGILFYM